eukprot:TRINITY_DN66312_c13_g1_i2.p1 TRINITY_DN66312_c13_g1~~TRINITY_DN66312_c13_g1_i2.p1  ORF type:complete len:1009 (-),score=115.38 TRINITY_DN66312_c13_g1_i2:805-3396(-)
MQHCDVRCMTTVYNNTHGMLAWTGEKDGSIFVVRVQTKEVIHHFAKTDSYPFCMCADNDFHVWIGFADGKIRVYNGETLELVHTIQEHYSTVNCLVFHEGHMYAGCGGDYRIFKFDAKKLSLAKKFGTQTGNVRALAIRGPRLFSAGDDATIRVWDLQSGTCTEEWLGHARAVRCMCMTDRHLWSGAEDGEIRLWDSETGDPLKILQHHQSAINTLTAIGDRVWSGGADQRICVWSAAKQELLDEKTDHNAYLTSVCMVKHTHVYEVWSAAADKCIKLWQAEVVDQLITPEAPPVREFEEHAVAKTIQSQAAQIKELQSLLSHANKRNTQLEFQSNQLQEMFDKRANDFTSQIADLKQEIEERDHRIASLLEEKNKVEDTIATAQGKVVYMEMQKNEAMNGLREHNAVLQNQNDALQQQLAHSDRTALMRLQQVKELENVAETTRSQLSEVQLAIMSALVQQGMQQADIPKAPAVAFHTFAMSVIPKAMLDGEKSDRSIAVESSAKLVDQVRELQAQIHRLENDIRDRDAAITKSRARAVDLESQLAIAQGVTSSLVSEEDYAMATLMHKIRSILQCTPGEELLQLQQVARVSSMAATLQEKNAYLESAIATGAGTGAAKPAELAELQQANVELRDLNEQLMHLNEQKSTQAREDQDVIAALNVKIMSLQEQIGDLEVQLDHLRKIANTSPTKTNSSRVSSGKSTSNRSASPPPVPFTPTPTPQPPPPASSLPVIDPEFVIQSRSPFVRNVYSLYSQIVKCRNRAGAFAAELSRRGSVQRSAIVSDITTIADNLKKLTDNCQWLIGTFFTEEEKQGLGLDFSADTRLTGTAPLNKTGSGPSRLSGVSKTNSRASAGSIGRRSK